MPYKGHMTGTLNQGCVPSKPEIGEKINSASERLNTCIHLAETVQKKLVGNENVQAEARCYEDCLEGNVEYLRDRLVELENMLTYINDGL